jgi:hypothetical protein
VSPTPVSQVGGGRTTLIGRGETRRFRPRLSLGYRQDLYALVAQFRDRDTDDRVLRVRHAIDAAEARRVQLCQFGVDDDDMQPTVYYIATLRLLRDLILQGWVPDFDDDGIYLLPPILTPGGEDPSEAKSELRNSFRFAVADQLLSPSVANFIAKMERHDVGSLFADGPELASRIQKARSKGTSEAAIRPVLELVMADSRDEVTGLRLQDVWRYARLQWSIPYRTTPGRNMHYLVRDEAGPNRPIIGIAALGNALLGLAQRDDALGWSVHSLARRLDSSSPTEQRKIVRHLLAFIHAEADRIYVDDFKLDGLSPQEAVAYLHESEQAAASACRGALQRAGDNRTAEYLLIREAHNLVEAGRADDVDWVAVATTQLYRRKRSANLGDTLRAIAVFEGAGVAEDPERMRELLWAEDGRRAVETVLRRIKQQALAENVMEIITCGAVFPYQQVLGGKLVAMLMTSPQVVNDVKRRYAGKISLIASGMAGRPICRKPALSLLTTSSLYAFGSAQYNRVRVPGDIVGASGDIRYERVGITDSFGTVQFASDTMESLVAAARLANNKRRVVNHLFGEGMSPKLRSLRMGLEALGLCPDEFLRHHSPRLLYAVPLATNTDDVLLGLTRTPKYVLPTSGGDSTTQAIAAHWHDRWLKGRLARPETLDIIRGIKRDDHLLSRVASDLGASSYGDSTSARSTAISDLRSEHLREAHPPT